MKTITRLMNATLAATPGIFSCISLFAAACCMTNPNLALLALAGSFIAGLAAIGCGFMGFIDNTII